MRLTETQRAWLAGFLDGEGCLTPTLSGSDGKLPYACIQITQKDRAILEMIKATLGYGGISRYSSGVHRLRIGARDEVIDFIRLVYPFAVVKKEALRLAFMLATLQGRPWRGNPVGHQRRLARRREIGAQLRVRPA